MLEPFKLKKNSAKKKQKMKLYKNELYKLLNNIKAYFEKNRFLKSQRAQNISVS